MTRSLQSPLWEKLRQDKASLNAKATQRDALSAEIDRFMEVLPIAKAKLNRGQAMHEQEDARQQSLYHALSLRVAQQLPGASRWAIDQGVCTMICALSPAEELELNLGALQYSPTQQQQDTQGAMPGVSQHEYLESLQQIARQHQAWFEQQMAAHNRQRSPQRSRSASVPDNQWQLEPESQSNGFEL